jgi:hypothetical protein
VDEWGKSINATGVDVGAEIEEHLEDERVLGVSRGAVEWRADHKAGRHRWVWRGACFEEEAYAVDMVALGSVGDRCLQLGVEYVRVGAVI